MISIFNFKIINLSVDLIYPLNSLFLALFDHSGDDPHQKICGAVRGILGKVLFYEVVHTVLRANESPSYHIRIKLLSERAVGLIFSDSHLIHSLNGAKE